MGTLARLQLALKPPLDMEGVEVTWLDAAKVTPLRGYPTLDGKGIDLTEEHIDQLVSSVTGDTQPKPIDGANMSAVHEATSNSAAPAAGWVIDAAKVFDSEGVPHLWLQVALHPTAAAQVGNQTLLFGSIAWTDRGVDNVTGAKVGAKLHSYALTNTPFVPGLAPHRLGRSLPGEQLIAASADAVAALRRQITMSDTKPEPAKADPKPAPADSGVSILSVLRHLLGDADAKLSEAELAAALKAKLEAEPDAPEPVEDAEAKAEMVALRATVKELTDYREAAEAAERERRVRATFAAKCAEAQIRPDEETSSEILAIALASDDPDKAIAAFTKAARPVAPRGVVMAGSNPAPADAEEDAFDKALAAERARTPNASEMDLVARAQLRLAAKDRAYGLRPGVDLITYEEG